MAISARYFSFIISASILGGFSLTGGQSSESIMKFYEASVKQDPKELLQALKALHEEVLQKAPPHERPALQAMFALEFKAAQAVIDGRAQN